MPELPEVETIARGLTARLLGRKILSFKLKRRDLRKPVPPGLKAKLEGRRIDRHFAPRQIHSLSSRRRRRADRASRHVGAAGAGRCGQSAFRPTPHDHVVFTLRRRHRAALQRCAALRPARLRGRRRPRRAPAVPASGAGAAFGTEFDGARSAGLLNGKKTSIKAALLDQRVVAGLGNIYVSESLYGAGISPKRLAGTRDEARAPSELANAIRDVLERAIAAGGSSLRDYVQASGELGYFQHQWAVYGKEGEPCPRLRLPHQHQAHRPERPFDFLLRQAAALGLSLQPMRRRRFAVLPVARHRFSGRARARAPTNSSPAPRICP